MISVPPFLLKRLYVKGSLRNNEQGFQFAMENKLGSGYGNQLLPLILDGQEIPLDCSYFLIDSNETPFSEVSKEKPFTLPMNKVLTIKVKRVSLTEGAHKIGMSFIAEGLGKLGFEVNDTVSGS
jgi:hydroxymethylglutaryl-CoA reductase (NADPH)